MSGFSSLHIDLDNPPEFYTNLDEITGRIVLTVTQPETIGAISVKLEGESKTSETLDDIAAKNGGLSLPGAWQSSSSGSSAHASHAAAPPSSPSVRRIGGRLGSAAFTEDHKVLYKVDTVFPGGAATPMSGAITSAPGARGGPYLFQPGRYEWQFRFDFPLKNACGNLHDMARAGGIMAGYNAAGQSLLGFVSGNSVRVMDESKQLFFQHVTHTLPPSLTGLRRADIRYYIKTTVARHGFLKENWRRSLPVRFMPVEPPRPPATTQEKFARRPFAFTPPPHELDKRASLFDGFKGRNSIGDPANAPPTIVMTARLPHPLLLTCNRRIPLRLIATKKTSAPAHIFLVSLQVELKGITNVKCYHQRSQETQTWVVVALNNINIPLTNSANAPADTDVEVDDGLWRDTMLPHSVTPSFTTCNISRTYELEIKLGISWAAPKKPPKPSQTSAIQPTQTIVLPLSFKEIPVYSGIAPPPTVSQAQNAPTQPSKSALRPLENLTTWPPASPGPLSAVNGTAPPLPPRQDRPQSVPVTSFTTGPTGQAPPAPTPQDPLYEDPPPSYDEAMADTSAGPFDGTRYGSMPAFARTTEQHTGNRGSPKE